MQGSSSSRLPHIYSYKFLLSRSPDCVQSLQVNVLQVFHIAARTLYLSHTLVKSWSRCLAEARIIKNMSKAMEVSSTSSTLYPRSLKKSSCWPLWCLIPETKSERTQTTCPMLPVFCPQSSRCQSWGQRSHRGLKILSTVENTWHDQSSSDARCDVHHHGGGVGTLNLCSEWCLSTCQKHPKSTFQT